LFVDYFYYVNDFKGTALTEEEFCKYGKLACMEITSNTLSRVTDGTINNFPGELISRIKDCACVIAQYLKKFQDTFDSLTGLTTAQGTSEGIVKSKTAGAVSVTYDTALSANYLLNLENQKAIIKSVLKSYLAPVCIGGIFYNLLSKVVSQKCSCPSCRII
jgi:hypothetical protein